MCRLPDLLAGAVERHRLSVSALDVDAVRFDTSSGLCVRTLDGRDIGSLDELRVACGSHLRWRPPRLSAALLDDRQQLVLDQVRLGRTSREISRMLGVSERTVTTIRRSLRSARTEVDTAVIEPISVVGRRSLLRDLVHDELVAGGLDVAPPGVTGTATRVRVAVLPSAGDLEPMGGARSVIVGSLPASVGAVAAVQRGVTAVLEVDSSAAAIRHAVDECVRGRVVLAAAAVQALADELWQRPQRVSNLTPREREILAAIMNGEPMKQTARRLGITRKTVENTRQRMYRKVGVRSAHELRGQATAGGYG